MSEMMSSLLWMTAGGTVLGLILWLLRVTLGKRLPSAAYYYAWLLVLARLVLPLPGIFPTAETQPQEAPPVVAAAHPQYAPAGEAPGAEDEPQTEAAPAAAAATYTAVKTAEAPVLPAETPTRQPAPAVGVDVKALLRSPALW